MNFKNPIEQQSGTKAEKQRALYLLPEQKTLTQRVKLFCREKSVFISTAIRKTAPSTFLVGDWVGDRGLNAEDAKVPAKDAKKAGNGEDPDRKIFPPRSSAKTSASFALKTVVSDSHLLQTSGKDKIFVFDDAL